LSLLVGVEVDLLEVARKGVLEVEVQVDSVLAQD
jgi:hypothetical protein